MVQIRRARSYASCIQRRLHDTVRELQPATCNLQEQISAYLPTKYLHRYSGRRRERDRNIRHESGNFGGEGGTNH